MSRVVDRLEAWWWRPAPALRLGVFRVLVGAYCAVLLAFGGSHYAAVGELPRSSFAPVGIVRVLVAPLPAAVATAAVVLAGVLCIAFTVGFRHRVLAPVFAVSLLWVTTYRTSWGHISHDDNLVVLHALVLSIAPAADSMALDARGARRRGVWSPRHGWPLRLMALITVLTYLLAGWAKLRFGGAAWLDGSVVRLNVAHDALRKARLGGPTLGLAALLLPQPWAFAPAAWATIALEAGAPLALLHRRVAAVWAVCMWTLHVGIALIMTLTFAYPLSGVAFAPLFRVERALARLRRRFRRGRRRA